MTTDVSDSYEFHFLQSETSRMWSLRLAQQAAGPRCACLFQWPFSQLLSAFPGSIREQSKSISGTGTVVLPLIASELKDLRSHFGELLLA